MSKKILIDPEEFKKRLKEVKATITYTLDSEFDADRLLNADSVIEDLLCDIDEALEDDEPKRYSVLEWHPVSEEPTKSKLIIRFDDESVGVDVKNISEPKWKLRNYDINHAKEWAYLPE